MALKSSNKKKNVLWKVLSIILLIVFLVFVWWFVYGSLWKINNIEIVDAKHTDIEAVKTDIYNITQKKKFLIIPNDHILFLSKGKIKRHILETYPSVELVDVSKTKERDIVISIVDRMAMGVWCDEKCYFFDDQGILFKKSFDFTGAVFTKWEVSSSTPLNFYDKALCVDTCIDKNFVNFLTQNKVMKVVMEGDDLRMFTEYGYYIKALNNASTTMRNIALFKVEYKGGDNDLEYVDVRFGDKIFYK
jgi:hypothetical protein